MDLYKKASIVIRKTIPQSTKMSFQLQMVMSMGMIKVRDLQIKRTGHIVPCGMCIDPRSPDEGEDNHDDELSDCLGEAQAWHQMNLVEIEQNEVSNEEWISAKNWSCWTTT